MEQLQKLQQQLDDKIKTDKKVEQNMRKKKLKTEKEVENWIHKYDHEMTDKANEIENLTVPSFLLNSLTERTNMNKSRKNWKNSVLNTKRSVKKKMKF